MEDLQGLLKAELDSVFLKLGYELKNDEAGYLAVKEYHLGKKSIFLEINRKSKNEIGTRLHVWITNNPVEKLHSLVNRKIASSPVISLPLTFLCKKTNQTELNFERKRYDGKLGSKVTFETVKQYSNNLNHCITSVIQPFLDRFIDQSSFHQWLNVPVLNSSYNFETGAIWKDAISSVIIAKLVCSDKLEELYEVWLSKELPKGPGFNTREELLELRIVLSLDQLT